MKRNIFLIFILLFSMKIYSQDIGKINIEEYKLDKKITSILADEQKGKLYIYQQNNDIYFLGWSKSGKIAYIQNKFVDGRGGCDLIFTILDLIEDKICFSKKIECYDFDENSDSVKKILKFEECIKKNSKEFNKELKKYEIVLNPAETKDLPVYDKSNKIEFKVNVSKKEIREYNLLHMSYKIIAIKEGKEKKIAEVENKICEYVLPTAYVKSPFEDRIALIVADAEYVFEGNEVFVNFYGCNLKSGFKN